MINAPTYSRNCNESKDFLKNLITQFQNGNPIVFERSSNHEVQANLSRYISELYKVLEKKANSIKNFEAFDEQYALFKKSYDPYLRWPVYEKYVDFLIRVDKIEAALNEWTTLQVEESSATNTRFTYRDSAIDRLIQFEQLLKKGIINGYYIDKIAPKGHQLTAFGRRNIDDVFKVLDTIVDTFYKESFFHQFFPEYSFDVKGILSTHKFEYYAQFFEETANGKKTLQWYKTDTAKRLSNAVNADGTASKSFVTLAIQHKASSLIREGENEYRKSIGAKKVGESWISETELFYKIKKALPDVEVIHHGRPEWLGRQHFDIWIPAFNCAIEYQGLQHDKPVDFFGGEEAYEKNQRRDRIKLAKAIANNVKLIEVRPDYDFNAVIAQIRNRR